MRAAGALAFVLWGLGCLSACRSYRGTVAPPLTGTVQVRHVAVEPGDVLTIEVFGEKDLSGKFQVSEAGTIDYPLVGRVKVTDMTPPEVANALQQKLASGYLKVPNVSVLAEEYEKKKKVYVWGQVQQAGTFPYVNRMTVIEALTRAGGLTPMADKGGISVTRVQGGKPRRYAIPMGEGQSSAYPLEPGDVIFVPERVF